MNNQPQKVTVTGFDISIWDWATALIKITIASIPALIVLAFFGLFLSIILSLVGGVVAGLAG